MSDPAASPAVDTSDDCSICLHALAPGAALLTLSCNHRFHLQCLASNVQAQNKQCPLCRTTLDASLVQMLTVPASPSVSASAQLVVATPPPVNIIIPSVEDLVDENTAREISERVTSARQTAMASNTTNTSLITASTALEFGGRLSQEESTLFGLVTLQAPPISDSLTSSSRIPIDLVCVVDQSGSMAGQKLALLKQTLGYIVDQLTELDRLAIVSFNSEAFDRSHGLKRMTQQNQEILKQAIANNISSTGSTYIGSGLEMAIGLLASRRTQNPSGAVLLLTDGQDSQTRDYSQLMQTLPNGILCHTFGYGPDHTASLLVQLAEQGNGGNFTYIDEQRAVGPALVAVLAGLLSCVARNIRVEIEFTDDYKIVQVHSRYRYQPEQLPSSKITIELNDLNADEQRNLVFELHVPSVASQESTSTAENEHVIGHVTIDYVEPQSIRTLTSTPIPFQLARGSQLSPDLLQVNNAVDIQRNRVETARVLRQAMEESDYRRSLELLKAQVEKINSSMSAQDPFCQTLMNDLRCSYPTEREYRSSHHHGYRSYETERGTYRTAGASSELYLSPQQRAQVVHFMSKYT